MGFFDSDDFEKVTSLRVSGLPLASRPTSKQSNPVEQETKDVHQLLDEIRMVSDEDEFVYAIDNLHLEIFGAEENDKNKNKFENKDRYPEENHQSDKEDQVFDIKTLTDQELRDEFNRRALNQKCTLKHFTAHPLSTLPKTQVVVYKRSGKGWLMYQNGVAVIGPVMPLNILSGVSTLDEKPYYYFTID